MPCRYGTSPAHTFDTTAGVDTGTSLALFAPGIPFLLLYMRPIQQAQ